MTTRTPAPTTWTVTVRTEDRWRQLERFNVTIRRNSVVQVHSFLDELAADIFASDPAFYQPHHDCGLTNGGNDARVLRARTNR